MSKGFLISLVFNVLLFGTIFYVKNHYMGSAKDYVEQNVAKKNELIKRLKNAKGANALLWELGAKTVQVGQDKKDAIKVFKQFVKTHADKLQFTEARDPQNKSAWKVSWQGIDEAFSISFIFKKDKISEIDYSGMIQ